MMVVLVLATIVFLFAAAALAARRRSYAGAARNGGPAQAAAVLREVSKALPLGDGVGASRPGGRLAPLPGAAVDSGADSLGQRGFGGLG
jgi:hypothetical protein